MSLRKPLPSTLRWQPSYVWQRMTRRMPRGRVHIVLMLGDHFEPAYVPRQPRASAPFAEQEARLETWCREYPEVVRHWRDSDGRPFVRSYFFPAEKYEASLLDRLADHCGDGWGEIEIHLHHGVGKPDTAENTRKQLADFRDILAARHNALCYWDGRGSPQYAFIHGSFALANSAGGLSCGVDSEMQVLAETGCYVDMTFPTGPFHRSQTAKINSLYECTTPLDRRESHRDGPDLRVGSAPRVFPLMVQGPLLWDFHPAQHIIGIENGALTTPNPPSIRRLQLWKKAAITVDGRPDWLFIKVHCHGMDPTQKAAMLGEPMRGFLRELVEGAEERNEILHFVTAREMVNIALAACDGKSGNPGDYRDYRLKRVHEKNAPLSGESVTREVVKN